MFTVYPQFLYLKDTLSNHLYCFYKILKIFVRPGRIELPTNPWQGLIIPLNHGRSFMPLCQNRLFEQVYPSTQPTPIIDTVDYNISYAQVQIFTVSRVEELSFVKFCG